MSPVNVVKYGIGAPFALLGLSGIVNWWYRPIPSTAETDYGQTRKGLISSRNLSDEAYEKGLWTSIGKYVMTPIVVTVSRLVLQIGNKMVLVKDEHYQNFLDEVVGRKPGQPLITVSNHRSLADDPSMVSNLLPYHIGIQPRYLRYGACAQEFCYNDKFPSFVHSIMVMGQSLPIARNGSNGKGGVNQKLLLDFSRYIAAGEWCHIFPEAAIYQLKTGALGGRGYPLQLANEEQEFIVDDTTTLKRELALKGNLKWGIGKMIAHSPVAPVVIPFHHMGMDDIIPQNPFTRKTLPRPPNMFGNTLRIKFGPKVDVSDLIEAHEAKYGKLWKYSPSYSQDKYQYMIQNKGGNHVSDCEKSEASMKDAIKGNFDFHKIWDSSEEELLLYHLITRRIESAIEMLSDHEQK